MTTIGKPTEKFNPDEFYFDEPQSGIEAEELLAAARLSLVCEFPFFGRLALNMTFVESKTLPTTAVDARGTFFYSRRWVNHFDKKDAVSSVAHETMHLVQRFFARKPAGANHFLFNLAADYVLETQLVDAGLEQSKASLRMITPEVQELVHKLGTVPAVYKHLLQEMDDRTDCKACKELIEKLKGEGQKQQDDKKKENEKINAENEGKEPSEEGGGSEEGEASGGHSHEEGGTPHTCGQDGPMCCSGVLADEEGLDSDEHQAWIEKVIGAKIHAESKGNMPAGLAEGIDALTQSKVRWQDHLKASATRLFSRDRYTFKRPNRRGAAIGMRLPGHTPDGKTAIGAIDTSASMSPEEVRQCVSEFSEIMRACGCDKLWLILHDTRVYYSGWVAEADLTNLKMARGGTSHIEVFDCLNKSHKNEAFNLPCEETVTLAILFTDLGTDFPEAAPDFEVIWGVPSNGCPGMEADVPFGRKVEVEVDED